MLGSRINPPLAWSLAAIALATLMTITAAPGLGRAVFVSGDASDIQSDLDDLVAGHEDAQSLARERFDGRSAFFRPPPIPVARAAPPPVQETPVETRSTPKPVGPLPPPGSYTGPTIMAFIGDMVWFQGDLRLSVGEEAEGVRVIAVDAPWAATLAHRGGEYEVSLFDRTDEKLFASAPAASALPGLIEVPTDESPDAEEDDEDGRPAG